jgi:arylsulfatase A-like enzyme
MRWPNHPRARSTGSVNENKLFNGIADDIAANLVLLGELGSPKTYNHYRNGWEMACNKPFKKWKRYEVNRGTSDPCRIAWPEGLQARCQIRNQCHYAIELGPTILDVLGVEAPATIKGHT